MWTSKTYHLLSNGVFTSKACDFNMFLFPFSIHQQLVGAHMSGFPSLLGRFCRLMVDLVTSGQQEVRSGKSALQGLTFIDVLRTHWLVD